MKHSPKFNEKCRMINPPVEKGSCIYFCIRTHFIWPIETVGSIRFFFKVGQVKGKVISEIQPTVFKMKQQALTEDLSGWTWFSCSMGVAPCKPQ